MYNDSISENDKQFADEFSRFVNGKMGSAAKTGKEWACQLANEAIEHLREKELYYTMF